VRLKLLAEEDYTVVAVIANNDCPAEDFILKGEESTRAAREGLLLMLTQVAKVGLGGVSSKWFHEASKKSEIYEFIRGPLRLFFFKGIDGQIAVCTSGVRKTGRKADKAAVKKAGEMRKAYFEAVENQSLEVVEDENQ